MCDYSLEMYKSRAAEKDETLTVHRFHTGTSGFVKEGNCETAVCLLPGTLLHVDTGGAIDIGVFAQLDIPAVGLHRDGLIFGTRNVSLQHMPAGTKATVLMLGTKEAPEDVTLAPAPAAYAYID